MKRLLKHSVVVVMAFGLSIAAHAAPGGNGDGNGHDNPNNPHTAPEFNAGLAAGALSLIIGAVAVLRARRSK